MELLIQVILENWPSILIELQQIGTAFLLLMGSASTLLLIAYKIALILPGPHPDKEIKMLYDLTKKLSVKKAKKKDA